MGGTDGAGGAARDVAELAERVAARLGDVPGVAAVVLGGSLARGEGAPDSDVDIGILYEPAEPPDTGALRELARELDDRHLPDLVTPVGGWGPWINGGGWLLVGGRRMDWIYRDLGLVRRVIEECRVGRPAVDYQPGHPHGFHSHSYLGEVHHCLPLHDPRGLLPPLKASVAEYPPPLGRALVDRFLWEAGFALDTARKPAARGEVQYVAGCLYRSVACMVQVLFARNGRYFLNEKGSVRAVEGFPARPPGFAREVSAVLSRPGRAPGELIASVERLQAVVDMVGHLCAGRAG